MTVRSSTECFNPFCTGRSFSNRSIILPIVLYGCETWSLTSREERKLTVFENMVLRGIFGPRRGRGNGGMEEIA